MVSSLCPLIAASQGKSDTRVSSRTTENYEAVSTAIFSYLSLLSKSGPQPEAFREIQSLSELSFAFAEKASSPSDYASDLASNLSAPWPREWSLSTPYLTREFDGEAFKKTLDLLTIERCRITLSSQALPKSVAGTWDKKEPIYGTEYKVEKFSDEFLDAVSCSSRALDHSRQLILTSRLPHPGKEGGFYRRLPPSEA